MRSPGGATGSSRWRGSSASTRSCRRSVPTAHGSATTRCSPSCCARSCASRCRTSSAGCTGAQRSGTPTSSRAAQALRHAAAASDWDLVGALAGEHWVPLLIRGELGALGAALAQLPRGPATRDPEVALAFSGVQLDAGDEAGSLPFDRATEARERVPEPRRERFDLAAAIVGLMRARLRGDIAGARTAARALLAPELAAERASRRRARAEGAGAHESRRGRALDRRRRRSCARPQGGAAGGRAGRARLARAALHGASGRASGDRRPHRGSDSAGRAGRAPRGPERLEPQLAGGSCGGRPERRRVRARPARRGGAAAGPGRRAARIDARDAGARGGPPAACAPAPGSRTSGTRPRVARARP